MTAIHKTWLTRKNSTGILFKIAAGLGLLAFNINAWATPIGPDNCSTCNGGIYTLTSDGVDIGNSLTTDTFRVTLTANTGGIPSNLTTAGGGHGGPYYIDAVAVKISSSAISATLFSAPEGTSSWQIVDGGLNQSGCQQSPNGNGFECADWFISASLGTPVDTATDLLTWVFDVTIPTGTFFGLEGSTGAQKGSIKMSFVENYDSNGPPSQRGPTNPPTRNHVGALLSENIWIQCVGDDCGGGTKGDPDPVPEPATLLLMGAGLLGLGWRRKRQGA